ncbi:MAG TPA: YegS/Rv2252/BmrU family lipid kinase [Puia sp.]|nr:YegS/Rv2252/BmrU family lipid kinase [Puia sp.]
MVRKIIYLLNPISGTKEKEKIKNLIIRKTRAERIEFKILPSRADGQYDDLRVMIKKDMITDVVICGGDGTLNAIANALQGVHVNIGIIPIGSGNSLALAAKIPKQTGRALDIIFKGNTSPVDAFHINEKFSCALCGIGFDAEVAHEFAKQKTRGLQTYLRISTMKFFKSKPYPFEIKLNNKIIKTEAYFISIANSNQFGNNFTIAPKASMSDGLLDIVIVRKMNKMILPFSVLLQVAGNNKLMQAMEYFEEKNIIYVQTDKISIRNPSMAPMHIDGEPTDTSPDFRIRIIPHCFRLIQPL